MITSNYSRTVNLLCLLNELERTKLYGRTQVHNVPAFDPARLAPPTGCGSSDSEASDSEDSDSANSSSDSGEATAATYLLLLAPP